MPTEAEWREAVENYLRAKDAHMERCADPKTPTVDYECLKLFFAESHALRRLRNMTGIE